MKKILLSLTASSLLLFGAYDDNGTDYSNAKTFTHTDIEGSKLEALKIVNMILKLIHDSKAESFINKGPYKALIKETEDGNGASSGSGITTTTEELTPIILDVTRDTSWDGTGTPPPMKVKFWMKDKSDKMPMVFIGYIQAKHGVDEKYPVGKMKLYFQGFLQDLQGNIDTNSPITKGTLSLDKASGTDAADGKADVKFIMQDKTLDGTNWNTTILNMTYNVNVDSNGDGVVNSDDTQGAGVAYTRIEDYSSQTPAMKSFEIAFSPNTYKIQEVDTTSIVDRTDPATGSDIKAYELSGNEICKSKTEFMKKVYQYGLYYENNGTRVDINAGFPIENDNNTTGYIGYWGLWSEDNLIKAGDVVHRIDGVDSNKNYTVFQTQGKLIKHTKKSVSIDKLTGSNLSLYTWLGSDQTTSANYIIHWDGSEFVVDGKEQCNESGCNTTPVDVNFSELNISKWSRAWSDTLQANIPVYNVDSNTTIHYHTQEVITPDKNLTLVNFGYEIINPDMNLSSDDNYQAESINFDDNNTVIGNVYKYVKENGVLLDVNRSNKAVVIPSDSNFSISKNKHPYWNWGAQMGPLLDADSNETDSNASTYNASNFWQVEHNATVFYTWETGLNPWNKSTTLIDNSTGNKVKFDKPIDIAYTHKKKQDINGEDRYDGKLFMLHYDGVSLGLPWVSVGVGKWRPIINIKSGTEVNSSNSEYVIKALNIGAIPKTLDSCDGVLNPSKDVNTSFVPVREDDNTTLLDINTTFIDDLNMTTIPDANVSVVKGEVITAP